MPLLSKCLMEALLTAAVCLVQLVALQGKGWRPLLASVFWFWMPSRVRPGMGMRVMGCLSRMWVS